VIGSKLTSAASNKKTKRYVVWKINGYQIATNTTVSKYWMKVRIVTQIVDKCLNKSSLLRFPNSKKKHQ
jgi:hypothetical protein